jgi:hypothetical protein
MTGDAGRSILTLEEAKAASAADPDLYRQYLAYRREFSAVWKDFVANYVRSSGKKTVPMPGLQKAMAAAGIDSNLPTGFTGGIDALGRWYSQFDELLDKNPGANMFPVIKMNPLYTEGSGTFVFQCFRPNGGPGQRGYAISQKHERADDKFDRVQDFAPKVDAIRRVWLKSLKSFDERQPATVAALMLELVFQFSARIGHFSSVKKSGYSTVVGGFQLKYLGKDDVPTHHKYKGVDPLAKQIVAHVATLANSKKPGDFLFTYTLKNGTKNRVRPSFVNRVFRECGAVGVTIHKLRTYNGTKLFRHEMAKVFASRKALTPKEAKDIMDKMAMKVGVLLNHIRTKSDGTTSATPSTALGSYIDLGAQVEFYQHYNLPLPGRLERFVKNPEAEEATASVITAAYRLVAEGESPKTMTPPPPKVKPADTKMKKVEEPIKPKPVTEKAAEPKTDKEDEDAAKKVIDLTPNPDLDEDPGEDLDEEKLTPEEKKDLKLSRKLEDQASNVMNQIVNYGEVHDIYQDDAGTIDNMLVDNRFPSGTEKP